MENKMFFPNLDGFRFLSFLLVFNFHAFTEIVNSHQGGGFIATTLRLGLLQSGHMGVTFFFVLSGFLITYLLIAEVEQSGKFNIKTFYIRRSLRIFPLYFALAILIFVVLRLTILPDLPNPIYYFLFLSNFDIILNGYGPPISNVMWSVAVEEQFYIVWAVLFYFVRPKYYLYIFLSIIAASLVFRSIYNENHIIIYFHTFSVMSDLAIGGLTAYLIKNHDKFRNFFIELPKLTILVSYTFIIPILLFNRIFFIYSPVGTIILAIAIAFIITEQNFSKNSFYKMGNFKLLSLLGKYTYGLYLLHPLVIYCVFLFAEQENWNPADIIPGAVLSLISLILSIGICYLSYTYFEYPFLKLKRRFVS